MRIDGLTVNDTAAIDIPSGPSLPSKHEQGYLYLLVIPGKRPVLHGSDGIGWFPVIGSTDDILNGTVRKYLVASDLLPADWSATSGTTRVINKPRTYYKTHVTSTTGALSVTWPVGRFTAPPIVNLQVVIPTISGTQDATHTYMANIQTCTATTMTAKITRVLIGSVSIMIGGNVLIAENATVPVTVMVHAEASE